jgi:hypothetical protein
MSAQGYTPKHRKYWVVSPNVKFKKKTVGEWREASVRYQAAFMGWGPDDQAHPIGPKFAGMTDEGVWPGDVILIARQVDKRPEIVGFGVVSGQHARRLKGFNPPDSDRFGSLRWLRPFKPWSRPPSRIPLIDAVRHRSAMAELHPEHRNAHRKVCDWMERQLQKKGTHARDQSGIANGSEEKRDGPLPNMERIGLVQLQENPQFDYTVRTRADVKLARKTECKLLGDYRNWLKRQGRNLSAAKYKRLRCDGYERDRKNLIEAKSAAKREHIRMAVGQLLDYAFQGKQELGDPNMAILLPQKPDSGIEEWLRHLGVAIIWQESDSFFDNANGQFS